MARMTLTAVVAAALCATSTATAVEAATATTRAPKVGGACTKAQLGTTATTTDGTLLACLNVNKRFVWQALGGVAAATATTRPAAAAASVISDADLAKASGGIRIDGSSTVGPLTEEVAAEFQKRAANVKVTVGISGTGGGFKRFCAGETDISNASRPITAVEKDLCAKNGIKYDEIVVANDGLAVVLHPKNTWTDCLTVAQLKAIWGPTSTVKSWSEVNPAWPNEPLKLYGAGTDSGTFDFFTEEINGKAKAIRKDYLPTEDDNVTVQGVSAQKGGMGFFGLSYALENKGKVKVAKIDGGNGCVAPNTETVQNGTYKPLGRPLYVYPSAAALKKPEVRLFVEFYLEGVEGFAKKALFIPLTKAQQTTAAAKVKALAAIA